MHINTDVKVRGARNEIIETALIDSGAEISLIPGDIASNIGAWHSNQQVNVEGIHGESRTLPLIISYLNFPSLNDIGGQFAFAMSNTGSELIVGMDILNPLGIIIDTRTGQLSVKNEIWEAFKTLSTVGVLFVGGVKILEALSE